VQYGDRAAVCVFESVGWRGRCGTIKKRVPLLIRRRRGHAYGKNRVGIRDEKYNCRHIGLGVDHERG
jgi:hypothetical protein